MSHKVKRRILWDRLGFFGGFWCQLKIYIYALQKPSKFENGWKRGFGSESRPEIFHAQDHQRASRRGFVAGLLFYGRLSLQSITDGISVAAKKTYSGLFGVNHC